MVNALNYQPLSSNTFQTVYWYPSNGFANFNSPTVAELNAGLNVSKATAWNNFSFKVSASSTSNDPSIADVANVTDRGAVQYGGSMSFYFPGAGTLSTDVYAQTYAALSQPRVTGYLVTRIDGTKPTTQAFAAGDLISVFLVQTDAQTNEVTGESAFLYTVKFIPQGVAAINTIARATTATVVVTPSTLALTAASNQKSRLNGTVLGREYTNGLVWTSSDNTKATVTDAGVVVAKAAGSVTITGTYPATGTSATSTVTIS